MTIFFYFFASLVIISSILVVSSKTPVHSVLWLIFAFCNSAGLMVLIGAEFLAMMLIIVYVGAVAVLFLFIVMMLDINIKSLALTTWQKLQACLLAIFLFSDLSLIIFLGTNRIERVNFGNLPSINNNTLAIGSRLYTEFILPFQTAGVILFVAMIAGITLTLEAKKPNSKRQDPNKQLQRNRENSIKLVKKPLNQGIEDISYDD